MIGPEAICALDARLVERIRARRGLPRLAASATLAIVGGSGAYGLVFGMWRGPLQSVYSLVKLPLILLLVAGFTAAISSIFALLLRTKLSMGQTIVCVLLSLSVASILLAAVAPVSAFIVLSAPTMDETVTGLARDDARVGASLGVSLALLLWHVMLIACAGIAGVMRLRHLLVGLIGDRRVVDRVLLSWMAAQLLVGSQVSWLLRPFLGEPQIPVRFFSEDALRGNFFEELGSSMAMTFGDAASPVAVAACVALGLAMLYAMREKTALTDAVIHVGGIVVTRPSSRTIPWSALSSARVEGSTVVLRLALDVDLAREELTVACASPERAFELMRAIDAARTQAGPFRSQPTTS